MRKVFIINEHAKWIELLTFLVSSLGHAVEHLADPLDLFDRVITDRPDLVIMDIHYEYIDGIFLVEKYMGIPDCRKVPILVVSSKNDPLSLVDSIERGAADFLSVPINEDQLIEKVKKLLPPTAPA